MQSYGSFHGLDLTERRDNTIFWSACDLSPLSYFLLNDQLKKAVTSHTHSKEGPFGVADLSALFYIHQHHDIPQQQLNSQKSS